MMVPRWTYSFMELPSSALRHWEGPLLPVVHIPETVKLSKVYIRFHPTILIRLERVGGAGAEETPIRTGAAALGVCVGGLEGHSWALAATDNRERR